jgi:hypothetical protein
MSAAVDFCFSPADPTSLNEVVKAERHLIVVGPVGRLPAGPRVVHGQPAAHRPSPTVVGLAKAPLRLTLRGRFAIALGVLSVGVGLLSASHLSAQSRPAPSVADVRVVPVQAGDTLWSIEDQPSGEH